MFAKLSLLLLALLCRSLSIKSCTVLTQANSFEAAHFWCSREKCLVELLPGQRVITCAYAKALQGGGAVEMALSRMLSEKAAGLAGIEQWPYKAVAQALEIIPRTLAQNCGANTVRILTSLRAKHAAKGTTWGINGETGELVDMRTYNIWEPIAVKLQVYKTAIETAILLLRIDDIVSGSKKKQSEDNNSQPQVTEESMKE